MQIEKMAAVGEIVSSVAIVITLAYLAIQTSQTRDALMANSRQAVLDAELSFADQVLNNPDLLTLGYDDSRRSSEDQARLVAHNVTLHRSREFVWLQYQYRVIDEATMRSYLGASVDYVRRPGNRQIWEANKRWLDPEFVAYFDSLLGEQ